MTAPAPTLNRSTEEFAHLGTLIRSILRRDRARLITWFVGVVGCVAAAARAMVGMYPDPNSLATQARALIMASPTGQAFGGPGYGVVKGHYTPGAIIQNELLMSTLLVLAIMSVLLAVRWTRAEEETGRGELVGAACTGRAAPLGAALTVGFGLNLAIAAGLTAGLMGAGLAPASSLAFGAGAGLTGWFFLGAGALMAQVFTTGRTGAGAGIGVMGLFYLIRLAGDLGHAQQTADGPAGSLLSWFSPFAWPLQTRAFVQLRWWPLVFPLVCALVLAGLAAYLGHRRDFDAGLVQPRAGRAHAKTSLRSPLALTVRLERGSFFAWAIGAAVLAGSCGYIDIGTLIEDTLADNKFYAQVLRSTGQGATQAFFSILIMYAAILAFAFAMNVVAHLHGAETSGLTELQLSTPVARSRLLSATLAVALGGGLAILLISGLTLAPGAVQVNHSSFGEIMSGALVFIPALLVFVGLGAALLGWAPRATGLMWLYLVYAIVARMFGEAFGLPNWATKASVLASTPTAPVNTGGATALVTMTVVGAVLLAAGYAGLRRRDIS